jgi:hypothetical protein
MNGNIEMQCAMPKSERLSNVCTHNAAHMRGGERGDGDMRAKRRERLTFKQMYEPME